MAKLEKLYDDSEVTPGDWVVENLWGDAGVTSGTCRIEQDAGVATHKPGGKDEVESPGVLLVAFGVRGRGSTESRSEVIIVTRGRNREGLDTARSSLGVDDMFLSTLSVLSF